MELLGVAGKFVAVLASIFAVYKAVAGFGPRRRTRLREDYTFLDGYVKTVTADPRPHNFLVEKGYLAFSGQQLAGREILFLLGLDYPSQALKNYARGRRFVEVPLAEVAALRYRGTYKNSWVRKKYQWTQLGGYGVSALLALSPLLFLGELISVMGMLGALILTVVCFLAFGALAFALLFYYSRIVGADLLMQGEFGLARSAEPIPRVGANVGLHPTPQGGVAGPAH